MLDLNLFYGITIKVTAGFEPAMTVLQTGALPLGYVTIYYTKKLPE